MNIHDILTYLAIIHEGNWDEIYKTIREKKVVLDEEIVQKEVKKLKCKSVTIMDGEYPEYLKEVCKPPFVLFYYGDISLLKDRDKHISVIGARECSEYGVNATKKIVKDLANEYVIVSGLAKGIDRVAHETAINNGGKTIAVLGCGIDKCYPEENKDIYKIIKENHLLISEYPGKALVSSSQFPLRNRIVAHLSKCLVVTEAKMRSGTSITVKFALCGGVDVCCVPYPVFEESLCNALIKEGAALVENGNDVIDEINTRARKNIF